MRQALSGEKVVAILGVPGFAEGPQAPRVGCCPRRARAGSTRILPLNARANTFGALDMGLAPDFLPRPDCGGAPRQVDQGDLAGPR